VKHYSSGMYVRLAFAVAAHLEPEILIIDEVLSVGDLAFQKKCLGKMGAVAAGGRTVLFVSHNMQAVNSLCSWAVLLSHGECIFHGAVPEVVRMYLVDINPLVAPESVFPENDEVLNLLRISLEQSDSHTGNFVTSKPIQVELTIRINGVKGNALICGFTIFDEQSAPVLSTYFNEFGDAFSTDPIYGVRRLRCTIPAHFLNEGRFDATVDVGIAKVRRVTSDELHRLTLHLTNIDGLGARFGLGRAWRRGPILPLLSWESI